MNNKKGGALVGNTKKIGILIAFLALIGIAGISMVFLANYNSFAPQAPVVLDDGKNIFITTSANEQYEKYRFKFISGLDKILIETDKNILSEQDFEEYNVAVGKTYYISTCYVGKFEGENSEWSREISWTRQIYLEKPEVANNEQEQKIQWQKIKNADYYMVSIKNRDKVENNKTTNCYYDYGDYDGGHYEFTVTAHSNNEIYKSSTALSLIEVDHIYNLKPLVSGRIENKILYVEAQERLEYVLIVLNSPPYIVKTNKETLLGGHYHYAISLKSIYNEGQSINVMPYSTDEYKMYNGDYLKI